eukprot:NODE_501_length_7561_cov_0.489547.p6 type:complete len:117 gc:universal NODE_501_length_7561_cov_0.489547:4782-4432(-)
MLLDLHLFTHSNNSNSGKLKIRNKEYPTALLLKVSKECFSEENILFLIEYNKYMNSKSASILAEIHNRFILEDSMFQLNLTEELRVQALASPENLVHVQIHVMDIICDNILPNIRQ